MERVTFLVEDTHERITAMLNPASVVARRSAVVRERRSLPIGPAGAFFDHGPVVTGGGITELELDLLFDTSLAGSSFETDDVRALTEPLWRLAEARTNAATSSLELPQLRLIWGKAWNVPAVVVALAERLEHFDASGAARRSWLRLRLRRVPERAVPSPPGGLQGMPATRPLPAFHAPATIAKNSAAGGGIATETKTDADIPDIVAKSLATGEAKELVGQASAAVEAAEKAFVANGFVLSLDLSIATNSFAFELSLEIDLTALTPTAVALRVAGWLRWAREGLSSLGASAARLGLAAIRRIKAGIEVVADRMAILYNRVAPELGARLAAVRDAIEMAARRIATLSRVVFAEVRRHVVDGYRTLAFAARRTTDWIEQRADAIIQAALRMGAAIHDQISKPVEAFLAASRAVASTIAKGALEAISLAGKTIQATSVGLLSVTQGILSGVRATLAGALHAAQSAADALLTHLGEIAPAILKWAKDTLVRSVSTLGQVAFAAASSLERATRFVLGSAASALSLVLARARTRLASRNARNEPSAITWELVEASASDDVASTDEAARFIRTQVSQIVPRLAAFERGHTATDASALDADLKALSALVIVEETHHFDIMITALNRPTVRLPRYGYTRLDLIAYEQCGDPRAWKRIAEANDIHDPLAILAGAPLDFSCLSPQSPESSR